MKRRAIFAIMMKDLRAVTANLQVWLPMVIVPLVLGVLMPSGLVLGVRFGMKSSTANLDAIIQWLHRLPESPLKSMLDGLPSMEHQVLYLTANYMLAPLFLLIPLMTASVIAADSFAGEKERGTLETLLFAPVDILSLFIGKVLASFVPALVLSLGTFLLCALSVNGLGWPLFGRIFFPHLNWLPLMLLVIPMISLLAILFNVFISARVATFQAAYQMGGLVVLPVIAVLLGQLTGLVLLDTVVLLVAGLVLAAVNFFLLRQVLRRLDRNLLFASQIK